MLPNDLGHFLHLASQQKSNFQSEHKPFTPKVCHMFHASKKRFSSSGKEASILAKWTLNLGAQGFNPMADPIIYDLCGSSLVTLEACNTANIAGHWDHDTQYLYFNTSFCKLQPVNSDIFSRPMKISSTPGWVSQLHVLIHIVRILFEAIIRSLKQSQDQWVCCTRKCNLSTSWKLPFQKFHWRLFKVDAWISELSSAFLDIANSGIYLTKAMGPTLVSPLKITFAHFAKLDSLQLQPYLSGTDCANKSKQFVGEGLGFFLLWLVVLLEISRNPNSPKHKNGRELEKTHGTHFITFSDKNQAEVSSASLGNPNGKCQCPVKVSRAYVCILNFRGQLLQCPCEVHSLPFWLVW